MRNSRYNLGVNTVEHKGNLITTSVGSDMDDYLSTIENKFTYQIGVIPQGHDIRPDLTSYVFYDTVSNWWLLMQYNNINDPFEGYTAGTSIKIPNM